MAMILPVSGLPPNNPGSLPETGEERKIPCSLPGFFQPVSSSPEENGLQEFLSRQYPHYVSKLTKSQASHDALALWLKNSKAPYFELGYQKNRPFRFGDLLNPSRFALRCFNTFLNLLVHALLGNQRRFNQQLLRYLNLKE